MNNEVVIHVRVDDSGVDAGFASVRGKSRKISTDIQGDVTKVGPKIATSLGESVTSGIASSVGTMPILLGAGALAASPVIGAALAGAVIGGAGVGGVIGGIMLVKDDPRVSGAGKALGQNLLGDLKSDASVFVQPVLTAINTIKSAWGGIRPIISGIFKDSSGFVQPLVTGALGGIKAILSGFGDLVHNGGPVISELGDSFTRIGGAIGDVMTEISGHAKEGASGIHDLTDAIVGVIRAGGAIISGLSTVKGWIDSSYEATQRWIGALGYDNTGKAGDALNKVGANGKKAAAGTKAAAAGMEAAGLAADDAASGLQSMQEHLDEVTTSAKGLFDATTSVGESLDNATAAAKKNGRTLDSNTEKGRANRTALSHLAAALKAQYEATVSVNGAGAVSDGVAAKNRQSFIHLAIQLGATKTEANKLANQILGIPTKHETKIHADPEPAITAARRAKGAIGAVPDSKTTKMYANTHDAAGRLAALQGQINAVHGKSVSVSVSVTGLERLSAAGHRIGGFKRSGGITGAANGATSTGLTWVGEGGPELLELPPGTSVHSNPDSMRMAAQGGDGPAVVVQFARSGESVLDDLFQFLLTKMQATNRKRFGNSAERMLAG